MTKRGQNGAQQSISKISYQETREYGQNRSLSNIIGDYWSYENYAIINLKNETDI